MSEEDKKMFHRLMYYNDKEHLAKRIIDLQKGINYLKSQLKQKENITKEIRDTLNNKRNTLTEQLLYRGYCDYEELLYQVDEEIRKILDKEYK